MTRPKPSPSVGRTRSLANPSMMPMLDPLGLERRVLRAMHDAVLGGLHMHLEQDGHDGRVMHRAQHPTLKAERSSMGIIDGFARDLVRPTEGEGFGRVIVLPEGFSLWSPEIVELAG